MRLPLLSLLLCIVCSAHAQVETPFSYKSENDNRLIKEDDSGKYYVASGDTSNIVYLGDDPLVYRLYNKDYNLLAEGFFSGSDDDMQREQKWTEYYDNGNIKSTGWYCRNSPVGLWEKFYTNGKIKSRITYGIILAPDASTVFEKCGPYSEYYDNGQVKASGLYAIDPEKKTIVYDTIRIIDPITGVTKKTLGKRDAPSSVKLGTWRYYDHEGVLEKKEEN